MRRSSLCLAILPLLTACAGDLFAPPVNKPGDSISEFQRPMPHHDSPALEENSIALTFSGGGMRASAFSYGVLQAMHNTRMPDQRPLTDAVEVVTGVSGGSVTAAYYAWKGDATFEEFRSAFLDKNAEAGLDSEVSISNVIRLLTFGGVNDNSAFPRWLNKHVFHDATYADVLGHRPVLWVSASDIINRTPFVFSGITFRPLCSDLSQMKLADAVAASAAVPGAFTPINIESFASQCEWQAATKPENIDEAYELQASAAAIKNYRDTKSQRYIKLLDGGLTDNFGVQGLAQARMMQSKPYAPLHPKRAVRLKNMLFLVVNSGRGPVKEKWGIQLNPPGMVDLASMITDTAIDANTHSTYDLFRLVMTEWRESLVKWRCGLPPAEAKALLGKAYTGWKCDDVQFYVTQISFGDMPPEQEAQLNVIPTRFVLESGQIDFLLQSAATALQRDATYQKFLGRMERR